MLNQDSPEETAERYGYNPAFVRRVLAKRKEERREREAKRLRDLAVAEKRARARMADVAAEAAAQAERTRLEALRAGVVAFTFRGSIRRHTYREIERRACIVFGVSREEIHGNRRFRQVVFARQFIMYWSVRLTGQSLPQIGRMMGGKDHTTILHGKRIYPEKRAKMGRYLKAVR